jgi:hypothetical protein
MKRILKEHESEKGDSWKDQSDNVLVDRLFQEIHEFEIKNDPSYELIDIANSCFLLWAKRKFLDE